MADDASRTFTVCAPTELAEVVDLVNAAYRGSDGKAGWTHEQGFLEGERVTVELLKQDVAEAPSASILLLREQARLLACVRMEMTEGTTGEPACHIGMLAVHPALQDGGVGRAVLEHAEAEGRRLGAVAARLTVVSIRDSLIAWYERRGYRRTGETEAFPYEDRRFGTPLRDDLEFVVLAKRL
jgi:ribosomal protein S18 acetylase RimI-like enzyme